MKIDTNEIRTGAEQDYDDGHLSPEWKHEIDDLCDSHDELELENAKLKSAIELQGRAAIRGMDCAKEHASKLYSEAVSLNKQSNLESLESERAANALLTDKIEELERKLKIAEELLNEIYCLVKGECPSLLNEDSGGDAQLDLSIQKALKQIRGDE